MFARVALAALVAALAVGFSSAEDKKPEEKKIDKKDEPRTGKVTGVVTSKEEKWIEVKADGEEKARKYLTNQAEPDAAKLLKTLEVGSRVTVEWKFAEHFRLIQLEVLKKPTKDDKKSEDKKDEPRKGTVTGVVSAKGDNWIEVKADGEEKARRYVPHWRGGAPAAGGGPDKDMLAKIKETPLNSRVKIDWEFEERFRVVKIDVVKKPDGGKDEPKEKRSGTIAGEIKAKKEQNNNVTIEVLAPGEEKARAYFVQWDPKIKGPIPEVLKAVKAANVGDKVIFDWEATNHGPAIVKFEVRKKPEEKK